MNPFAQLQPWWHARNPRERLMLAVMLASLAAFALWFGLLWPARAWRDSARDGYDQAVVQLREVQAAASRVDAYEQRIPARSQGVRISKLVLDGAVEAGVGVSRQRQDGSDRFVVEIDSVQPQILFPWLDTLRREHSLVPRTLKIERAGAGVQARLSFSSATP